MTTTDSKNRLDEVNIELSKELWGIHSSLAIYRVIGLNAKAIRNSHTADAFFGFVQNQSLSTVALGLSKVFERQDAYPLCSVDGVYRLAREVRIEDSAVAARFSRRYGVSPSGEWAHDVDQVFSRQRPRIRRHMRVIDRVRNTRLAHIQQQAPKGVLPSIGAFEELLTFAFDFHSFVGEAFLAVHPHPILHDKRMETSVLRLLRAIGVRGARADFQKR